MADRCMYPLEYGYSSVFNLRYDLVLGMGWLILILDSVGKNCCFYIDLALLRVSVYFPT